MTSIISLKDKKVINNPAVVTPKLTDNLREVLEKSRNKVSAAQKNKNTDIILNKTLDYAKLSFR